MIEAVTENPRIKEAVLADTEKSVRENTIIASNTSTISITRPAKALQRPENFVGMHFFNPVHMMPLVEVIRGEKTSEEAIATTVVLAQKMGKTPIVVNDCPGFWLTVYYSLTSVHLTCYLKMVLTSSKSIKSWKNLAGRWVLPT